MSAARSTLSACERPGREAGYSLVALLATLTIMLTLMAAAAPTWRYIMKDANEEELIFRGGQIADAIARYQRKNGNALPPSLEVLVKGKYLRKAWNDPMTKHGRWRLIRQGDIVSPILPSPAPGMPTTTTTTRPAGPAPATGFAVGGIQGVASTSTEKSLRLFNGRSRYSDWLFLPGQARVIGRQPVQLPGPGALFPSPAASARPSPAVPR